jgi:Cof subfamily protein (haloacid dehalogenase superfamily)
MIQAVFFDVDGTIFSHEANDVPASTHRAITELQRRGVIVGLATGRSLWEIRQLPLKGLCFDVLLTLNGHLVLDGKGNYLDGNPLVGDALASVLALFRGTDIPVTLVEQNRMYINFINDDVVQAQTAVRIPLPETGHYEGADVFHANVFIDASREAWLRQALPGCDVTRWHDKALDVNARSEGGKAAAILRFASQHGIAREEIAAFGDAENDIAMLRAVGVGVCMGNGSPEAKAAADLVTDDIDEDGVAHALQRLSLI